MNIEHISRLHEAAKVIEEDGIEGVRTATTIAGEEVALALLIAHLRRGLGSEAWPSRPDIGEEIIGVLKKHDLVKDIS